MLVLGSQDAMCRMVASRAAMVSSACAGECAALRVGMAGAADADDDPAARDRLRLIVDTAPDLRARTRAARAAAPSPG
ncbi:hypothetical protein ACWGVR_02860 [Streptomyces xanthophaeus]